jgi:alpha-soluble NSF attachment protein
MALSNDYLEKGNSLINEGDNLLAKSKTIWYYFSRENTKSNAIELYRRAGNLFKLYNNYSLSSKAYLKAARHMDELYEAASLYIEGANALLNSLSDNKLKDLKLVIKYYDRAINIYINNGKWNLAAKKTKIIAELYDEYDILDKNDGINRYIQAIDLYEKEGNNFFDIKQCSIKIALYKVEKEEFIEAIKIFDDIARKTYHKATFAAGSIAKTDFLRTLLVALMFDNIKTDQLLNEYRNLDHYFASSRECKFIENLLSCINDNNVEEEFSNICFEYDNITPLDPWQTSILLKIKIYCMGQIEIDLS